MPSELTTSNQTQLLPALETRFSSADDSGLITGFAAGFGDMLVDAYGTVLAPGAFSASLRAHKAAGTMPAMLWQHDPAEPIGRWTEILEDSKGLHVKGEINQTTQRGREALSLLKQGALRGLSIAFVPKKSEPIKGNVLRFTKVDLWEISLVTFPARKEAKITEVREIRDMRDLEERLRNSGVARAAAQKIAAAGWAALNRKQSDQLNAIAARLAALANKEDL